MIFFYFYIFFIGITFGSFINVCIMRYQTNESVISNSSHCECCQHKLNYVDLIPIISWIVLKGKCRYCNSLIPIRYPLIECFTGILFLFIFSRFQVSWNTIIYFVASSTLLFAAFVDFDIMIIPDRTHLILIICSILLCFLNPSSFIDRLVGSLILALPFLTLALMTNSIGYGDIKLLFSLGLFLGCRLLLIAFFVSSFISGFASMVLILAKNKPFSTKIPYGPFLVSSAFISLLYGNDLLHIYLSLFHI